LAAELLAKELLAARWTGLVGSLSELQKDLALVRPTIHSTA